MQFEKDPVLKKYSFYIIITAIGVFISFFIIKDFYTISTILLNGVSRFLKVITPLTTGLILAYILSRPLKQIEKFYSMISFSRKIKWGKKDRSFPNPLNRTLSIITLYLIIILIFILIGIFVIPQLSNNIRQLSGILSDTSHSMDENIEKGLTWLEKASIPIDTQDAKKMLTQLSDWSSSFGSSLLLALKVFSVRVLNIFLAIVITFYILQSKERIAYKIRDIALLYFKPGTVKHVEGFLEDVDHVLGRFIIGVITDAFIIGTTATIILTFLDHNFAVLGGMIVGCTNVVPYFGPIIGGGIAATLGLLQGTSKAVATLLFILALQQIDGNILQPRIVGKKVGLDPLFVILAVIVFGRYWGFKGMVIAVPTMAVIKVIIIKIINHRKTTINTRTGHI